MPSIVSSDRLGEEPYAFLVANEQGGKAIIRVDETPCQQGAMS